MSFLEMPCYYNLTINIEAVTYHLNNTIGADSARVRADCIYLCIYLTSWPNCGVRVCAF